MVCWPNKARLSLLLAVFFLFMPARVSSGSEAAKRYDAAERTERRTERKKQFLLRAAEDMDKSRNYVNDTIGELERQIDAIELLEPGQREQDLRGFLDWYQNYEGWLRDRSDEIKDDLDREYSRERGGEGWIDRYQVIGSGYERMGGQLTESVAALEKMKRQIEAAKEELWRVLKDLEDRVEQEKKQKDQKGRQAGRDRNEEEKEVRRASEGAAEIDWIRMRIAALNDREKHVGVLLELGRYERDWVSLKANDSSVLSSVAQAITGAARRPLEDAFNLVIRTYESDMAYLGKKADEAYRKRTAVAPSGSLRTLDRLEDMAVLYDKKRTRYEHHIAWLREQVGAYRAELTLLSKEK